MVPWSPISDAVITVASAITQNFTQNLPHGHRPHLPATHDYYAPKKSKTLDFHQVKGYQDLSTWARGKGCFKIITNHETPCSYGVLRTNTDYYVTL